MSRRLQKTASKAALLLACPRPFEVEIPTPEADTARDAAASYGTRFHAAMAQALANDVALGSGEGHYVALDSDPPGLFSHVAAVYEALLAWMAPSGNPWGLTFRVAGIEVSGSLSGAPTQLIDANGEHRYEGDDSDIFGTADLILEAEIPSERLEGTLQRDLTIAWAPVPARIFRVVLDHKTGQDHAGSYSAPASVAQMRALAAIFDADAVAILHAPQDAPAVIYAEACDTLGEDLEEAASRVGHGFLRVGPECRFCPARQGCPAAAGEDVVNAGAAMMRAVALNPLGSAGQRSTSPGAFHEMLAALAHVEKAARARIRALVESGVEVVRPDGKRLVLESRQVERFSKEKASEETLAQLREEGILAVSEETRLVAR